MLASIMYKCVITGRQMTLPLLLSWYSLLFWKILLVQTNSQGGLKAHQLSIKNPFSLPGPQRGGKYAASWILPALWDRASPLNAMKRSECCHLTGFYDLHSMSLSLDSDIYPSPLSFTHYFFLSDVRILWLFTFWILITWSCQLLPQILIFHFIHSPNVVLINIIPLTPIYYTFCGFICSFWPLFLPSWSPPEGWNLFWLY